ncbi:hypothetical protein CMI37_28650 [Candidatus Pacearchaeota archaeon]|nr:hypothetical protein [Candidatus Pacearchaeota archaeon]|tara:strand:+ start:4462 stop:4848 length:387 start_codon:yes stop_codon:yes gene_type:complete
MKVEVSNGEILDKLSILEIKIDNITDKLKLNNVKKEYSVLKETLGDPPWASHVFRDYGFYDQLKEINEQLWVIEDNIRIKERNQEFDKEFVDLARSVYQINDERAEIKKEINTHTGSELVEEKSYEKN